MDLKLYLVELMPFADTAIFWPYHGRCRPKVSLIPDFISNCGMARVFCLLYGKESSND
jgi:hypothetical protein